MDRKPLLIPKHSFFILCFLILHPTSLVWTFFSNLHYITGYPEATDFLLEHGADVNMKNPPLNSKHEPVLAYLVEHHGQKATPELVKFCSRLIEEYDVDLEAVDDEKKDVIWTCAETLEKHPGKKNASYVKQMACLKEVQQMMLRTHATGPCGGATAEVCVRGNSPTG